MEEILTSEFDVPKLRELIKKYTTKQLIALLSKSIRSQDRTSSRLLAALLKGMKCETKQEIDSRLEVFMWGFHVILEGTCPSLTVLILGTLLIEVSQFPSTTLMTLFEKLIGYGTSHADSPGNWLELLPRVISCLAAEDKVFYQDKNITGEEFVNKAIHLLCETKWSPKITVTVVSIMKDLALSSDQLELVVTSFLERMNELDLDCVPPLVYQLNLICAKGQKRALLIGVINYFNEAEENVDDGDVVQERQQTLRQTEGTVLLHLLLAVKDDRELGQEFVKWHKSNCFWPKKILTTFTISLVFCIANITEFKNTLFSSLKTVIFQNYKESLLRKGSFWIRKFVTDELSIENVFDAVVECVLNWDQIVQSLIEFGFYLMESTTAVSVQKKSSDSVLIKTKACSLGASIVYKTFKKNQSVREVIITNILNAITPTERRKQYTSLLAETILFSPRAYVQCISKVQDNIYDLVEFSTSVATDFLIALQPLLLSNSSLRESVILLLRKTMVYKDIDVRKIAVHGSLICFKHFRNAIRFSSQSSQSGQSFSQSQQYTVDTHYSLNSSSNEALSLELIAMLQRCFSQQAELRMILYIGFPNILKNNSLVIETFLQMLLEQANSVIEAGANPPIRFQNCVQEPGNDVIYMEPLPYLLRCSYECLMIAKSQHVTNDEIGIDETTLREFSHPLLTLLEDLRDVLTKFEIDDFELEGLVEHSPTGFPGNKNSFFPKLLLGVYEALIEFTFFNDGYTSTMVENIMKIFEKHKYLTTLIKKTMANPKKKKKDDVPAEKMNKAKSSTLKPASDHIFSSSFLIDFFNLIMDDADPDHQESAIELKHQTDFINYLIITVEDKLSNILEFGYLENENKTIKESFNFCCSVGHLFFHEIIGADDGRKNANEILLEGKIFKCLSSVFNVVHSKYSEDFLKFLQNLEKLPTTTQEGNNEIIGSILKKIQILVTRILSEAEDKNKIKLLEFLFDILSVLTEYVDATSSILSEFLEWIENLCLVHPIDDNTVSKNLFNLFLKSSQQFSQHLSLLMLSSQDVLLKIGSVDDDANISASPKYALITEMNGFMILPIIIQYLNTLLYHLECIISKMKARCDLKDKKTNENAAEFETWEKNVCSGLAILTTSIYYFLKCDLPAGLIGIVTNLIIRFYTTLQETSKYYILMYKLCTYQLPNRFLTLIDHINSQLTDSVYSFISINNQEEGDTNNKNKQKEALSKAAKESVYLPKLVFSIEQYERHLIKLSKISKVNLTSSLKRSTNRDFRIDMAKIAERNGSDEESQQDPVVNSDEEKSTMTETSQMGLSESSGCPPTKRLKLSEKRCMKTKKIVVATYKKGSD